MDTSEVEVLEDKETHLLYKKNHKNSIVIT